MNLVGWDCLEVFHGDSGANTEHPHEVDRAFGVVGFVQDPVDAELGGSDAEAGEHALDHSSGDRGMAVSAAVI